ncbi:DinB family protein [Mycobacteroides immunogenum]|uniref:DinB family protein n=1 Tax=Mycobacteroides immunogenum TaxID=83262 RepID=UPI0025B79D6C|nr:DinB family protein [Mycobacteroides immunogenum]WJR33475.1 DinB family protein [Mycobacteroides immunogenum]
MPAMPPPVLTELDGLIEYIAQQQDAFRIVAFGLTDEQARLTPTAGTLSIGGLIKHVTHMQAGWTDRIVSAPGPGTDHERADDEFALGEDETLAGALAAFGAQSAATLAAVKDKGLDTPVPIPSAPWFPKDIDAWNVRWVALHIVEELARHAGHADIIRETIDGATMYELLAAAEGWEPTDWLKPWTPKA